MKIGIVGLGRMGAGMAERLRRAGHEVVGYDRDPKVSEAGSLEELVGALSPPRAVWLMVPAGEATESAVRQTAALLAPGDIIVDGGNSWYKDSLRRAAALAERGIALADVGTSGGIWGRETGYCLMVGGSGDVVRAVEPILRALAPEGGYAHVGPSGAGHYTKMVHNAVEYAMLQAYAEGFDLLRASDFGIDLRQVAALWNRGGVVRSWLLELAERAFAADPALESLRGYVEDTGEGRWALAEAAERGVAADTIARALFARFTSRQADAFAMRFIAAMRREFGGHAVRNA